MMQKLTSKDTADKWSEHQEPVSSRKPFGEIVDIDEIGVADR